MKRLNIKKLMSVLVLGISVTLGVAGTFAQGGAGSGGSDEGSCNAGCYLGCYAGDLNLGDAQKVQMKELMDRHREATAGLREQLRTLRQQSGSTEDGAAINEATVRAAAQTRANLRVELEVAHARLTSELNALLTPEQKARRAEQQRQRAERVREWRSRRAND